MESRDFFTTRLDISPSLWYSINMTKKKKQVDIKIRVLRSLADSLKTTLNEWEGWGSLFNDLEVVDVREINGCLVFTYEDTDGRHGAIRKQLTLKPESWQRQKS